jgi:hypothetical protein
MIPGIFSSPTFIPKLVTGRRFPGCDLGWKGKLSGRTQGVAGSRLIKGSVNLLLGTYHFEAKSVRSKLAEKLKVKGRRSRGPVLGRMMSVTQ